MVPLPAAARTSHDQIVQAGRTLLERDGLHGLTMQAVATAVGVRAPSLYKRVRDRDQLVQLITEATLRELTITLRDAAGSDASLALPQIARAFREFAHRYPSTYGLLFGPSPGVARVDPELNAAAVAPVLQAARALAGPDEALAAARTVVAWAHGFVSMELAGAFRLGGDVDAAFEYGIDALQRALGQNRRP